MARTPSLMVELGLQAPNFKLLDVVSDEYRSLEDLKSDVATVVMFICNHCPFVKHVNKELVKMAQDYIPKGVSFIAINSNDVENYPDDSPEKMKQVAFDLKYPFPYLFDDTQEIAAAYDATCTPDFFVYNRKMRLEYRGQLDNSRPGNDKPVNGLDIRRALNALIDGEEVDENQQPSIGCGIKWKA